MADLRGKGMLIGIELVADKQTKEPLAGHKMAAIVAHCVAQGAIVGSNTNTVPGFSNVLIVAPPLVLTPGDADVLVAILKQALDTQL